MTKKALMVGGMILSALATIASFLPYLAIYFIIQEIVGAYPDFDALDVPKVLGFGGLALGGVLLNVLLYTASVALSHIAAYVFLFIITHDYELIASACDSVIHIEDGRVQEQYFLDEVGIVKLRDFFSGCYS